MFKPIKARYDKIATYRNGKGKIVEFLIDGDTVYAVFVTEDGHIFRDGIEQFKVIDPGMVPIKYRKGLVDDADRQGEPA